MARLIDADALKEKICNNVYPLTDFFNSRDYGMFWTGGIEKAIDEAPTIDAEPIQHGKWIKVGDNTYRCSRCNEVSCCNGNFCTDCGARMENDDSK